LGQRKTPAAQALRKAPIIRTRLLEDPNMPRPGYILLPAVAGTAARMVAA